MIRRILALFTGRTVPPRVMPVSPVPKLPSEPRVMRRTEPAVRIDRMSASEQKAFWAHHRRGRHA